MLDLCTVAFLNILFVSEQLCLFYVYTRSLGALRAPTSSWGPFGPLDFVLRALRALRPCDPRNVAFNLIDSTVGNKKHPTSEFES